MGLIKTAFSATWWAGFAAGILTYFILDLIF